MFRTVVMGFKYIRSVKLTKISHFIGEKTEAWRDLTSESLLLNSTLYC